jgi:hypothetical protein
MGSIPPWAGSRSAVIVNIFCSFSLYFLFLQIRNFPVSPVEPCEPKAGLDFR